MLSLSSRIRVPRQGTVCRVMIRERSIKNIGMLIIIWTMIRNTNRLYRSKILSAKGRIPRRKETIRIVRRIRSVRTVTKLKRKRSKFRSKWILNRRLRILALTMRKLTSKTKTKKLVSPI